MFYGVIIFSGGEYCLNCLAWGQQYVAELELEQFFSAMLNLYSIDTFIRARCISVSKLLINCCQTVIRIRFLTLLYDGSKVKTANHH